MHRNHAFLNLFVDVSDEVFAKIQSITKFNRIEAGTQIVKLGEVPTKIYLIVSGVIRCYLCTEDGKEFNKSFYLPVSFVGSLTALIKRKPSIFVFETLTDCKLYEVDYYELMDLCKENATVNKIYTKVLESLYIMYEKRLVELISLDATGRYLELRKQIDNVDDLIPQYHIASYLGITPVQLSRIRKKIESD